jgi:CRISPR-associated endonuclease/helicase Cas3
MRLPDLGRVVVFEVEGAGLPRDSGYRAGTNQTRALRQAALFAGGDLDPDRPEVARSYYTRLLGAIGPAGTDQRRIQELRAAFDYPKTAAAFRMIEDDTVPVVVTHYGNEAERARVRSLVDQLRDGSGSPRHALRALQPYVVSLYRNHYARYKSDGFISDILPDAALGEWLGQYHAVRGLQAGDLEPDALVL